MRNVCIVDDEERNLSQLEEYLVRFGRENGEDFHIEKYADGLTFLASYSPSCDLVLLDIQMPGMDGMETARKLRKMDDRVGLIFITNLLKYAVNGYEVRAFDYIVKPVNYDNFASRIKKYLAYAPAPGDPHELVLSQNGMIKRVLATDVRFVEVRGHNLQYRLPGGEVFTVYGSLVKAEQDLPSDIFVKCNSGILVNLNYVQTIDHDNVRVDGEWLPISRAKKREFVTTLTRFLSSRR